MMLEKWRPRHKFISRESTREVEQVFDEMEQLFEEAFGQPFFPIALKRTPVVRAWSPPLEVIENENEYVIKAELPGMKKEEIEVSVIEDIINIKGERKTGADVKKEGYQLCERCYGNFERSVSLPKAVDTGKIAASYENGILEIKLPKVPEAKPKKVEIAIK